MHLGRKQSVGTPHNSKDYTFKNITNGAKKGNAAGRKAAIETKAGYDVKTRMNVPSSKGAGKASRTQRKMKAKG
jgi:hypothetical protein